MTTSADTTMYCFQMQKEDRQHQHTAGDSEKRSGRHQRHLHRMRYPEIPHRQDEVNQKPENNRVSPSTNAKAPSPATRGRTAPFFATQT